MIFYVLLFSAGATAAETANNVVQANDQNEMISVNIGVQNRSSSASRGRGLEKTA